MNEERHVDSPPQGVSVIENVVGVKWKPKHDRSLLLGNDERIICSISNSKCLVDDFISVSSLACLEFYDIDFSDYPISFWERRGEKIKTVKFSYCILELNTVSSIIKYCTSLVTFGLRISDLFIETKNPSFSKIFEYLVKQGKTNTSSVQTLQIVMKKTSLAPCHLDQTILNLLQIFSNFKSLTLKHKCDPTNYSNYSTSTSARNANRILWHNIFDFIKRKSPELEGLNMEFSSPRQINYIWQLALNRQIVIKEYKLTELTLEMAPTESFFPHFKNYILFLKSLKCLKTITCKLLHQGSSFDSQFLNQFLRDVIQKCHNSLHLKIEYFQADIMKHERNQWNVNFELLRAILSSNLVSLRIHVDCCDIFLNSNRNELEPWWNDSIEFLSLSFLCKTDNGKQHETMAAFLSKLENLRHLHLGGDINDDVLKSIWTYQKTLKSLSLYVYNSSVITEAGFITESANTCNDPSEELEDISENLEYLRFVVQKEKSPLENDLELPLNMFKKFSEFRKLRYVSFGTNTDDAEMVIKFCEQLKNFEELKGLFIECKIKETHIDFLYNACRYCPCLERIYIKNNHAESKSFSVFQYKDFFRYCTSLKLFIHESGKAINRWFKNAGKSSPERISEEDEIYFISTDVNDMQPDFWLSSV